MRPETENPTWNYPTPTPDTWVKLVNDIASPSRAPEIHPQPEYQIKRQSLLFQLVLLQYHREQGLSRFSGRRGQSWRRAQ